MHRFSLLFILIGMFCLNCFAQGENNNWYFGYNAGMTFNSGGPVYLLDGEIETDEGTACMSNAAGELLFYSDGVSVWNKSHTVMPNGTGLKGGSSSSQSVLILPILTNPDQYYLFTVTDWMDPDGKLYYSILDMTLDGGMGDILSSKKNILICENVTEKLVAAQGNCGDIWVLTHERANNNFLSFQISKSGIGSPVISATGTPHISDDVTAYTGVMKVSPDNTKLALATLTGIIEVFKFDKATGIVSDAVNLPLFSPAASGYGVCFSPDNLKLYVGEGKPGFMDYPSNKLYQYDLSVYSAADIIASKILAGQVVCHYNIVFDLQLAPDDKIYTCKREMDYLGVINFPNIAGAGCNYDDEGFYLGGKQGFAGLQNLVVLPDTTVAIPGNIIPADSSICKGQEIEIVVNPSADSVLWGNGNTESSLIISDSGYYTIEAYYSGCKVNDTIQVNYADVFPGSLLPEDTSLCAGENL